MNTTATWVSHGLKRAWQRMRFGVITEKIVGFAGDHVVSEVEFYGRNHQVIGYWAYGSFDPSLPFQGGPESHYLKGQSCTR